MTALAFVPWLPIYIALVSTGRPSRPLTGWKRWPTTRAGPLDLKCDKHLDVMRNLKNSEANLLKAREDLKEMTKARDSAKLGLASA